MSFAILGVAGYVAPRHLEAIHRVGQRVVAAMDPHDSVGVLDRHFPHARYFRDFEAFVRHVEALGKSPEDRVRYVSICSPNDLHESHVRTALSLGADAICEKPLVLEPSSLDALGRAERETGRRVYGVLQLRHDPGLVALERRLASQPSARRHDVEMTYVTPRGPWYHASWKGSADRSGGLGTNIGIHLFDLLLWLFGPLQTMTLHSSSANRMSGYLELERANVRWFLSIDSRDVPPSRRGRLPRPFRSLRIDGEAVPFDASPELHVDIYREALAGRGLGLEDVRPSVELAHTLRHAPLTPGRGARHPLDLDAGATLSPEAHELLST